MHDHTIIDFDALQPRVRVANHHGFIKGWDWQDRVNPDPQLILCLNGTLLYEVHEHRHCCGPGTLLFIEPGIRHSLCAQEDGSLTGLHVEFYTGSWVSRDYKLAYLPPPSTRLDDEPFRRLSALFLELAAVYSEPSPWRRQRIQLLATYLLMMCGGHWRESNQSPSQSRRAREILSYVREHLADSDLSRASLARAFAMTPGHLNHIFRRDFGCTPVELVHHERCCLAHQLLTEQEYSVKEAGYAVGFSSPAYFSRIYKKVFAIAPKEARKATPRS